MTTPRRKLRFESPVDAFAEVDRLVLARRGGRLNRLGNWDLGQALGHLATWAEFALDGSPSSIRAPWFVRATLRLIRGKILRDGMMSGVKIRGIPGGTLGTEPMEAEAGAERFRTAMQRLQATCPTIPNPVFGRLTHDQWIALNLRHAELHLSFFTVTAETLQPAAKADQL